MNGLIFSQNTESRTLALRNEQLGSAYQLKSGDQLCFRQYNSGGAVGGVVAIYGAGGQAGNSAWRLADTAGAELNQFGTQGTWTSRCGDLSRGGQNTGPVALGAYSDVLTPGDGQDPWDILLADMSITSTDGTVTQVSLQPNGQTAWQNVNGNGWVAGSLTATVEQVDISHDPTANVEAASMHYFASDHLGTAQLELASAGYPVWQGQFAPYGDELDNQYTNNHYKFTGKERDAESGPDYFGARYYGSTMGRWMSPDWSAKQDPVPYAKLHDPQSLNLYSYVGNNPLARFDPDGHDGKCGFFCKVGQAIPATAADFGITESNVRAAYNAAKSPNMTPEQRTALKLKMREGSTPLGKAIAEAHDPKTAASLAGKTATQQAESAGRTNPAFTKAGEIAGKQAPS